MNYSILNYFRIAEVNIQEFSTTYCFAFQISQWPIYFNQLFSQNPLIDLPLQYNPPRSTLPRSYPDCLPQQIISDKGPNVLKVSPAKLPPTQSKNTVFSFNQFNLFEGGSSIKMTLAPILYRIYLFLYDLLMAQMLSILLFFLRYRIIIWPILDPAALINTFLGYDFITDLHRPIHERGLTNPILICFKSALSGQKITYLVELSI